MLGGSFFCSRTGIAALRNIRRVIPTLAQLLARQLPEFSRALANEIARDQDARHKEGKPQVERLLCTPLLALKNSQKHVVLVIDALDECGDNASGLDEESNGIVSQMLESLVTFSSSSVNLPVSFLVTSRPETQIRDTSVSDAAFSHILRLQAFSEDEVNEVNADISQYITETIRTRLSGKRNLQDIITKNEVRCLVELCDGLFVFAATALKYTFGAGDNAAVARFKELLNSSRSGLNATAAAPLDRMYQLILANAADADDHGSTGRMATLRILASVLSARMTLSVAALAGLLGLQPYQVHASLSRLHAVINLPEDDDVPGLCTVHASFGDYLFDRAPEDFIIPRLLGHEILARGCLRFMGEHFRVNVPQVLSSDDPNPMTQPDSTALSLRYACLHWADHVSSSHESKPIEPQTLQRVFASVLFARTKLSVRALADLLNMNTCDVRTSLLHQRALVHVPEDDDTPGISTIRVPFGEHPLDQTPHHIQVIQSIGHNALARGCLDVMSRRLRFNISRSRSSYEPNRTTKPESITLALEYACLHWAYHAAALLNASDLDEEISIVFRPRFLAWLEVMSLLRRVEHATRMLHSVAATVANAELAQFLRDAQAFVTSTHEAIERSASHIYLSALPFADKNSVVYQDFVPRCAGLVTVNTFGIGQHDGESPVMTLAGHHGAVSSVSYSSDGLFLASGSEDGSVRIGRLLSGRTVRRFGL